jgi:hypothetical protein
MLALQHPHLQAALHNYRQQQTQAARQMTLPPSA